MLSGDQKSFKSVLGNANRDLIGVIQSARGANEDKRKSLTAYNPNIRYSNKISVVESLTVPIR